MKRCFKCFRVLPRAMFYRHPQMRDGHLNKCIDCTKRDVRERYALTRPERSAYEQMRTRTPGRRMAKLAYQKRHRERHPDRCRARQAVANAIRDGRLKRGPCQFCGTTSGVEAHHRDYSKPLDVEWVCFRCHRESEHGQVVTNPHWRELSRKSWRGSQLVLPWAMPSMSETTRGVHC